MEGPRGTGKEEFNQVMELVNLVFRTSRGMPATMQQQYPLLFNAANLDNMRVILEDGKPVTHIGICEAEVFIYGCRIKVGMIGAVCTHPEYRGRGFASMALADAMGKMKEDGVDVVLISGTRGLYDRACCAVAGRAHRFRIKREDAGRLPAQGVELTSFKEEDTMNLLEAHQKEPVRFHRTLEDFKTLLQALCPGRFKSSKMVLMVGDGSDSVGYLVVRMPREESECEVRASWIMEYGGARKAIAGAFKLLFDQYDAEELDFKVPAHDREMLSLLRQAGIDVPKTIASGGTIRTLNLPSLMGKIQPYLQEQLGEKIAERLRIDQGRGGFSFHLGQESLIIKDERDLTRLLFGTPETVNPNHEQYHRRNRILPKKGKLTRVLQRIFPLPSIMYGLNTT